MDYKECRNDDESFDLEKLYEVNYNEKPTNKTLIYLRMLEDLYPITSRQCAAVAICNARALCAL